jgi:DNA-3-methyladenine glycosylase
MDIDLNNALSAANNLLGWKLINITPDGTTSGYIVETEAYNMFDEASHSFNGRTNRTEPMFQKAGTIYVYFTYGMHTLVNIVASGVGDGQAVLIRALQPVDGLELMQRRRGMADAHNLTNGPAKLVQSMGITKVYNGANIFDTSCGLYLEEGFKPKEIVQTTRVGIKKAIDKPWRFYIKDNLYVSKK